MALRFARSAAVAAVIAAAVAPGSASGATTPLGGSPLNVHVGPLGQLQAFRTDGLATGIFYPPTDVTGNAADAGLFIAVPAGPTVYGFPVTSSPALTEYTAGTQGAVTGAGAAADPLTQVTTYTVPGTADISQTTTYVNGSQQFQVRWHVTNTSGAALSFKAMVAADFYFDGSDRGTGIFTEGPPRFIGGTNADTGNSGGFVEALSTSPPWSHYQALEFGGAAHQVWGKIAASASSTDPTFDDTVIGDQVDNAGAVEWDQFATGTGLDPGASTTFVVIVRSAVPSSLQLSPTNAGSPRGVPVNIMATAVDTSGRPYAGKSLRYEITGVNPTSGSATLGPDGRAVITDPGAVAGDDTIVAFVDFNNDGLRELAEPQASALATFVDTVSPSCTVRVTGDRPGGGGAGKPLVITVNCNETSTVTVSTKLTPPPTPAGAASRLRRPRPIRLRKVTRVLAPGKRFAFKLRLPRKVARKYAGQKLRAVTTVTAKDPYGNVKRVKKRHTIRVRPLPRR